METESLETESIPTVENSTKSEQQPQAKPDKEMLRKHKFYRYFLKRVLDILLSGLALIILSPVYLVVSILVRCKLGSPVIFKQLRVGKNGELFRFIKFRSMTDKKDENGELLPDYERLTKFGKLLRKSSIDELPQLWLVFIGRMSLIGPRPRDIRECIFLNEEQYQRHLATPGITGWAQAHGRNHLNFEQVCEYDRYYVEHCSLWLDIKTIFLTIKTVLKKDGINGDGVQANNTSEYHGDYLLRTGKITKEEYDEKLATAKELARKTMEK